MSSFSSSSIRCPLWSGSWITAHSSPGSIFTFKKKCNYSFINGFSKRNSIILQSFCSHGTVRSIRSARWSSGRTSPAPAPPPQPLPLPYLSPPRPTNRTSKKYFKILISKWSTFALNVSLFIRWSESKVKQDIVKMSM